MPDEFNPSSRPFTMATLCKPILGNSNPNRSTTDSFANLDTYSIGLAT